MFHHQVIQALGNQPLVNRTLIHYYRHGSLFPDNPLSGGGDLYVGPNSSLFGGRPRHMRPRFDPPGLGGIPDPDMFPTFPSQNPRFPGHFGPGHFGPGHFGPGGMGGDMFG